MGRRPVTIAIASVISVIFGVLVLVDAIPKILIIALAALYVPSEMYTALLVGVVVLVQGIIGVVAGIGLWSMKKWSGVLGIIFALLTIFFYTIPYFPYWFNTIANFVLISLIARSWNWLWLGRPEFRIEFTQDPVDKSLTLVHFKNLCKKEFKNLAFRFSFYDAQGTFIATKDVSFGDVTPQQEAVTGELRMPTSGFRMQMSILKDGKWEKLPIK